MTSQRLVSLDAFRGFTIAAMVLVNNPGDWNNLYPQLEHAKWNGWTFTDLIFPFFLFISGVSMALSLGRLAEEGAPKGALLRKLARRAALIFLIGFLLNLVPYFNWAHVRIPGVLQRIALCTLAAGPILVYTQWRGQLAWAFGLLALYSWLMLGFGELEPGRDFGSWVDRLLISGHMWVQTRTWDPEGLTTTLCAISTLLFGAQAGRLLRSELPRTEQVVWLLLGGLVFFWLGAALDAVLIPINKSLWTPSYCLLTAGLASVMFAAFYWLLDVNPYARLRERAAWWTRPFVIYGMNALFIFAFSGLVAKMLGFMKLGPALYGPIRALPLGAVNTSLLYALAFNACMFAVAWVMWRRQWFVKV
ncbi:MAG: acyltransferase family protein [Telluria sp.]